MATQNFKRNLFLNLYREEEKKNLTLVCFLLPLKREIKKCLMLAAYFLPLETPGLPACYPLNIIQDAPILIFPVLDKIFSDQC